MSLLIFSEFVRANLRFERLLLSFVIRNFFPVPIRITFNHIDEMDLILQLFDRRRLQRLEKAAFKILCFLLLFGNHILII